jgi:CheY-like chemotaxis protein
VPNILVNMKRVLIIDHDPASALALRAMLEDQGYEVRVQADSTAAVRAVREFKPDSILIDFLMPKAHGGDVAWQLHAEPGLTEVKLVLYSHIAASELRSKLPPRQITILKKPVRIDDLMRLLT